MRNTQKELRRKLKPSFCTLRKSALAKTAADAADRRGRLPVSEPEQGVRPGVVERRGGPPPLPAADAAFFNYVLNAMHLTLFRAPHSKQELESRSRVGVC